MQKTAYEVLISDWSSDVCSSDLDVAMLEVVGRLLGLLLRGDHLGFQLSGNCRMLLFGPLADLHHVLLEARNRIAQREVARSAERSVGKEVVRTGRSRW